MEIRNIILFLGLASIACQKAHCQTSFTEQLIRWEIIQLGGEVEGALKSKVVRVGFQGRNFTDDHFEMLCHCPFLKWFSCIEVGCTGESLRNLSNCKKLEIVTLTGCTKISPGLKYLANHQTISELTIEDCFINADDLLELRTLPNLKRFSLQNVSPKGKWLDSIKELKQLEFLNIFVDTHVDESQIEAIKKSLPKCKVDIIFLAKE